MIALPIAVLVLLAVFGLSVAVTMPFIFAACTVMATLGGVYVYAHFLTTATYVTNLVFLIGLGIAIDYSLLVIYRFAKNCCATGRRGGDRADDADRRPRGRLLRRHGRDRASAAPVHSAPVRAIDRRRWLPDSADSMRRR